MQLCRGLITLLVETVGLSEGERMFSQKGSVAYPVGHLGPGGDALAQIPQHPDDDHTGLQPVGTSLQRNGALVGTSEGRSGRF